MSAPEKIWARPDPATVYMDGSSPLMARDREFSHATEYVRADIAEHQLAEVRANRDYHIRDAGAHFAESCKLADRALTAEAERDRLAAENAAQGEEDFVKYEDYENLCVKLSSYKKSLDKIEHTLSEFYWAVDNFWGFLQGEYGVNLSSEDREDFTVCSFFSAMETAGKELSSAAERDRLAAENERLREALRTALAGKAGEA